MLNRVGFNFKDSKPYLSRTNQWRERSGWNLLMRRMPRRTVQECWPILSWCRESRMHMVWRSSDHDCECGLIQSIDSRGPASSFTFLMCGRGYASSPQDDPTTFFHAWAAACHGHTHGLGHIFIESQIISCSVMSPKICVPLRSNVGVLIVCNSPWVMWRPLWLCSSPMQSV